MEEKAETPAKDNMGFYSHRIRQNSDDTKEQEATFDDTGNNNLLGKTLLKEEDLSTLPQTKSINIVATDKMLKELSCSASGKSLKVQVGPTQQP